MARIKARRGTFYLTDGEGHGLTVAALERADNPGSVRLKWWEPQSQSYRYLRLPDVKIRNPAGSLDFSETELVRGCLASAARARAEKSDVERAVLDFLASKGRPRSYEPAAIDGANAAQGPVSADPKDGDPAVDGGVQSLREALNAYLEIGSGYFPAASRQRSDELTMAEDLASALGSNLSVGRIRAATYRKVWRALAKRHFAGETREVWVGRKRATSTPADKPKSPPLIIPFSGPRHAERTCDLLRKLMRFLYDGGDVRELVVPPSRWKEKLREEWKKIGNFPKEKAAALDLDYTSPELKRLYSVLWDADWRLRLAIELFPLSRLGQGLSVTRADFVFDVGPFGALRVEDRGQKFGPFLLLTEWQRTIVDAAIAGPLARFEMAFLAQELEDYPLMPEGRFPVRGGSVKRKALSRDGLRRQFQRWEKSAGITHVDARGWYGIKRKALSVLGDITQDTRLSSLLQGRDDLDGDDGETERIKNLMSGHQRRRSRQRYVRAVRPELWLQALALMERVRAELSGVEKPGVSTRPVSVQERT